VGVVCVILEKQHKKRIERKKSLTLCIGTLRDQDSGLVVERLEEEKKRIMLV
jgi:hypothetical protein